MAAATTLTYVSGNTNGRVQIDTIKIALTGLTSGTWYDIAIGRPDGIGGLRVQSAADGTATAFLVPQTVGAYSFTVYPTNYTVGAVAQPGPQAAGVTTTGFNMVAVAPDGGMAFPTATVSAATLASANTSA